jgi:hypothetical protein
VQFVSGGPLYTGVGISVTTPAGNSLSVCRVAVPPPPETIVTTFPAHGGTVVLTRSGAGDRLSLIYCLLAAKRPVDSR